MNFMKKNGSGILVCLVIAIPSWLLGKAFPVAGGPVIAIIGRNDQLPCSGKIKEKQNQE